MTTALLLIALVGRQQASVLPGRVIGVVVSAATGTPLADVRITIIEGGLATRTGADGRFELPAVSPGSATVTISTIGYIFVRRRITIPAGGTFGAA